LERILPLLCYFLLFSAYFWKSSFTQQELQYPKRIIVFIRWERQHSSRQYEPWDSSISECLSITQKLRANSHDRNKVKIASIIDYYNFSWKTLHFPSFSLKPRKEKNKRNYQGPNSKEPIDTLVTLHDETQGPNLKSSKKSRSFSNIDFLRALPKILIYIKHILENFAILALIAIFLVNRYANTDIVHKYKYNNLICTLLFF
jgi:hypothetical protein